jgi:ABC-type branched-subunit amino acid transport system ATPase component/branched-subunit amino acid ABC-type transport system permease component
VTASFAPSVSIAPRRLAASAAVAAGLVGAYLIVNATGWSVPGYVLVLGAIIGTSYGLLSVGLILIFRTSRLINFALAQAGVFAAALMPMLVAIGRLPYWLAFVVTVLVGGVVSTFVDATVVRRLAASPRVVVIIATLCVGALFTSLTDGLNGFISSSLGYSGVPSLEPPGLPEFFLGPLLVTRSDVALLIIGPVLVVALGIFYRRSRYGLAVRAAASNADAARLAAISPLRMSALTWAIAGVLATVTAILLGSAGSASSGADFGPGLLLRALSGAVIARMRYPGRAVVAGVALGIVEQVVYWNRPGSALTDAIIFVTLAVALLLQRGLGGRADAPGSWAAVAAWRPLPDELRRLWLVRRAGVMATALAVGVAILVARSGDSQALTLSYLLAGAVVALGAGLLTGLAGELTFGHYAVAGLAGVAAVLSLRSTGSPILALLVALATGAIASTLLAVPSLRARGLTLTVTSLSFALLLPSFVLTAPWLLGKDRSTEVPRLLVGGVQLQPGHDLFWANLVCFLVALTVAWNVWRGGFGRKLAATRDNEAAARAFGISAAGVRIQAFLVAGIIGGLGGTMFVLPHDSLSADTFSSQLSVSVILALAIGGLSVVSGAVIGSIWVLGLPTLVAQGAMAQAASYSGVLAVLLAAPGGILHLLEPGRDRLVRWLATLRPGAASPDEPVTANRAERPQVLARPSAPTDGARADGSVPLLAVRGLCCRFGGITAVDDLDFTVGEHETLGLIGPNGAGKTTTFEALSGFVRPAAGTVTFAGQDIGRMSPQRRSRLGLVRSFQDALLFPTLPVTSVVALAMERHAPTRTTLSVAGLDRSERRRRAHAEEVIAYFGLAAYRNRQVRELSTGTRRLVELACLISMQPRLLLLDEPSSGIAQRETEALSTVLRQLRTDFQMTLVVIEHDIPLITSISDRLLAMDRGRLVREGTPEEVRHDPRVVASYLGSDSRAIERSSHAPRLADQTR